LKPTHTKIDSQKETLPFNIKGKETYVHPHSYGNLSFKYFSQ